MAHIYDNAVKEQKILKHAAKNNLRLHSQFVSETCVMFTVHEDDLESIKKFCENEFGSCNVVEEIGEILMCKVKT